MTAAIHLLLATDRPMVQDFFSALTQQAPPSFLVSHVPVDADALVRCPELVAQATVAIVDVTLDFPVALPVCQALHRERPSLPIAALCCCPHSITPWRVAQLVGAGVANLLDWQRTGEEALHALRTIARHGVVLDAHLGHLQDTVLRRAAIGHPPAGESPSRLPTTEADVRLLELVARGLSDEEIGPKLGLSPHTVKRHLEGLRQAVNARNRTELAAWAGQYGCYQPPAGAPA